MEIVLATFGGIFVLISLSLDALLRTRSAQSNQRPLAGDRIASAIIGMGLIATAVVLGIDAPTISLVSTFGVTLGFTLLYVLYLLMTRSR